MLLVFLTLHILGFGLLGNISLACSRRAQQLLPFSALATMLKFSAFVPFVKRKFDWLTEGFFYKPSPPWVVIKGKFFFTSPVHHEWWSQGRFFTSPVHHEWWSQGRFLQAQSTMSGDHREDFLQAQSTMSGDLREDFLQAQSTMSGDLREDFYKPSPPWVVITGKVFYKPSPPRVVISGKIFTSPVHHEWWSQGRFFTSPVHHEWWSQGVSSERDYEIWLTSDAVTRFTHEWGEEMHIKSLSQRLNVDLAQPGLKPQISRSRGQVSTTRPRRHILSHQACTLYSVNSPCIRKCRTTINPVWVRPAHDRN